MGGSNSNYLRLGFVTPLVVSHQHRRKATLFLSHSHLDCNPTCYQHVLNNYSQRNITERRCTIPTANLNTNQNMERNSAKLSSNVPLLTRRNLLFHLPLIGSLMSISQPLSVHSESGDMHAELSELASKIPGAGMPDVYYPSYFQGDWAVSRELYAVETVDKDDNNKFDNSPSTLAPFPDAPGHIMFSRRGLAHLRDRIGRRELFSARFLSHRGHVIEDRLFNAREEFHDEVNGAYIDLNWDKENPNILSATWGQAGGKRIRESKVTKRAFTDGPQGYGTFVSSEYARVVDVEGEGGLVGFGRPPSIFGRRRIIRYRVSSVTIENLEPDMLDRIVVDYIYPPSPAGAKAVMLLKYRDFLNRK